MYRAVGKNVSNNVQQHKLKLPSRYRLKSLLRDNILPLTPVALWTKHSTRQTRTRKVDFPRYSSPQWLDFQDRIHRGYSCILRGKRRQRTSVEEKNGALDGPLLAGYSSANRAWHIYFRSGFCSKARSASVANFPSKFQSMILARSNLDPVPFFSLRLWLPGKWRSFATLWLSTSRKSFVVFDVRGLLLLALETI